jgi:hypothetical protein
MRHSLITLLSIIFINCCFSQENFKIINASPKQTETIDGYILQEIPVFNTDGMTIYNIYFKGEPDKPHTYQRYFGTVKFDKTWAGFYRGTHLIAKMTKDSCCLNYEEYIPNLSPLVSPYLEIKLTNYVEQRNNSNPNESHSRKRNTKNL